MSPKPDGLMDRSSTDCDFSEDNKNFKERLRKKFLYAAGQGQAAPLLDDALGGLSAAGDEGILFDTDSMSAPGKANR